MTTWSARTRDELRAVSHLLHDALIIGDSSWHEESGLLTVSFAQERNRATAETPRSSDPQAERVAFMRGALRIHHATRVVVDDGIADAGMLVGISYDDTASEVTIEGVSGNVVASVTGLDVDAWLSPEEVGMWVQRRSRFGGISERPLPERD